MGIQSSFSTDGVILRHSYFTRYNTNKYLLVTDLRVIKNKDIQY